MSDLGANAGLVERLVETSTAEVWIVAAGAQAAHVRGSWLAVPGRVREREVWCVSEEGPTWDFPLSERRVSVRRGDRVAWDLDRDPAGHASDRPWIGLAVGGGARTPVDPEPLSLVDQLRDAIVTRVGGTNLAWFGLVAAAALATQSPALFVAGTSFVHYLLYIATFHQRRGVAFPAFTRDALAHKTVSMASLGAVWLSCAEPSLVTAGSALGIAGGVALSMSAARALGFERTYFGVELGRIPWVRVEQFPYGVVPHPMIAGALFALVAAAALPELWASWPWLVPLHIGLYVAHLVQEIRATPS